MILLIYKKQKFSKIQYALRRSIPIECIFNVRSKVMSKKRGRMTDINFKKTITFKYKCIKYISVLEET